MNIFLQSEGIKNQLKEEYDLFMQVHQKFGQRTKVLSAPKKVKWFMAQGSSEKYSFATMKNNLSSIQKALDALLEKKRRDFPRFYFLSNDELLEMIQYVEDLQFP